MDVLGHGLSPGSLARLIRSRDVAGPPTPPRARTAHVPASPVRRAPRPGWFRRGSCAGGSRNACGCHRNACRRAGPGQGACVGLNKNKVPSMYEMQGTLPGLAAKASQLPGRPMPRAARQSQEPARGSGFPTPPTSRSCPQAVPVSNGESISTASARDRASLLPHHFLVFSLPAQVSTGCDWLSAFIVGFPPPYAQPVHRLPGVTRRTPNHWGGYRGKFRCWQIRFSVFAMCDTGNDLLISGSVGQSQFRKASPAA